MATTPIQDAIGEISDSGAIPHDLELVAGGKAFSRSPVLQKLLLYLWVNRDQELNEYTIAVDALGKATSFNPAVDATVRVNIGRLRQKLRDHFLDEGIKAPIKYEIPFGSHRLVQVHAQESLGNADPHTSELILTETRSHFRLYGVIGAVLAVILIAVLFGLSILRRPPRSEGQVSRLEELQPWKSVMDSGKPLRIIVPTPVFFSWKRKEVASENQRLLVRDVSVNAYDDVNKSPELTKLLADNGKPLLGQTYTVISDTYASITLARFLDKTRASDRFEVLDRAGATLPSMQHDNLIILGTSATLTPFRKELDQLNFSLAPGDEELRNRHPLNGEPAVFSAQTEAADRSTWPGIIAVLPGDSPGSVKVLLVSRYTSALASFLTSKTGLQELQVARQRAGSPAYFEAVVSSEMSADRLISQRLLVFRPFSPSKS